MDDAGAWWVADLDVHNPLTSYRFLLAEGRSHPRWLNGSGVHRRDVTDAHDFRVSTEHRMPDWVLDQVGYQVFPDRFERTATGLPAPDWAHAGRLGRPGGPPRADDEHPALRRHARRGPRAARPPDRPRRDAALPDAGLRGPLQPPLRRRLLRPGGPAARRRRRALGAAGRRPRRRPPGRGRPDHQPHRLRPRLVRAGAGRRGQPRARVLPLRRRRATRPGSATRTCPSSTTGRPSWPGGCTTARTRSWPTGCARAWTAGGSTWPT